MDSGRSMRGGQWQALWLHEGLVRAGCDSRLFAPPASPLYRETQARGLPVEALRFTSLWRAARVADLVHAHDARAHTLAALTAHPRLVVSRRVAFPLARTPWSRWKQSRARRWIAVSEYARAALEEAGIEASRIAVVYDGVPLLPLSTRRGGIIAPASDDPLKGGELLQAAERLGDFRAARCADLVAGLRDAALLIYLSRMEGLGSGVLLAMSAGVPVVASRVGGLPEIVRHGQTGLLVENTPGAVSQAVRTLISDPELALRMGVAGRSLVRERFTLQSLVQRTLDVYREVLSCSQPSRPVSSACSSAVS